MEALRFVADTERGAVVLVGFWRGLRDLVNQGFGESFFFFQVCLLCLLNLMQAYKFTGFQLAGCMLKKLYMLTRR